MYTWLMKLHQTYMPTDRSRNRTPTPRNIAANRLISNSLKITPLLLKFFGRDTTNTKNHDVKNVPMINNTPAKCGNTDGLIGDTYLVSDSIVWNSKKNMLNAKRLLNISNYNWNSLQLTVCWSYFYDSLICSDRIWGENTTSYLRGRCNNEMSMNGMKFAAERHQMIYSNGFFIRLIRPFRHHVMIHIT